MVEKKREYGDLPNIASGVETFRCEVCAIRAVDESYTKTLLQQLQGRFVQCPECGRWICPDCWDENKIVCKLCAREIPTDFASEIKKELEGISTRISAIEEFIGSLKKCQECGAMIIDPKAKFCGFCGADNLISSRSSLLSEILRNLQSK